MSLDVQIELIGDALLRNMTLSSHKKTKSGDSPNTGKAGRLVRLVAEFPLRNLTRFDIRAATK